MGLLHAGATAKVVGHDTVTPSTIGAWLRSRLGCEAAVAWSLQGLGSSADGVLPGLYVGCALSNITEEARQQIDPLVEVLKAAISEATLEAEKPWEVSVYAPIEHSAPWNRPDLEPRAVYQLNADRLWTKTDGLILLGHAGGSYGGGQEFAWAAALRLPVLYVAPVHNSTDEVRLSRQVEGTPVDLTVCPYCNTAELREGVKRWVRTRRTALEALAQHRMARPLVHAHLHDAICEGWAAVDRHQRLRATIESGLDPRRVEALITDVHAFAAASMEEVTGLATALGIGLSVRSDQFPELTESQLAALATAASECEWAPARTLELEHRTVENLPEVVCVVSP